MKFEERLLETRKNRGMSQETLAEKIGVSRQAVSKWETGEAQPDYARLIALADALEVSLDYLCGREPRVENVPATVTENPEKKQKVWVTVIAIAAVLVVAVVGLWFADRANRIAQADVREEPAAAYLPDTIELSGANFGFGRPGSAGCIGLEYQFVSNIVGEQYAYQVHFRDLNGEVITADAMLEGGGYFGWVDLPYGYYSVTVTVSNGFESRAAHLAEELEVKEGSFSCRWE